MGLESYFVNIVPLGVETEKKSNIFIEKFNMEEYIFKEKLKELFSKIKFIDKNSFILDKVILVKYTISLDGYLSYISMEMCFSCYELSLAVCFKTIEKFSLILDKIMVQNPLGLYKNFEEINNYDNFIIEVKNIYDKKYKAFVNEFGKLDFRALPNDDFYKKYQLFRIKHFFKSKFIKMSDEFK